MFLTMKSARGLSFGVYRSEERVQQAEYSQGCHKAQQLTAFGCK